jgi:hypothetical protein
MSGHKHGCDGDDNHDETPEMGLEYSLYSKIDIGNLECLNEKIEGTGKDVFKAWEDRMDFEKVSFRVILFLSVSTLYHLSLSRIFHEDGKICYLMKC